MNYTIEDFEMGRVLKQASGSWCNKDPYYYGVSTEGKFDINYSDILTFLIQTAGRVCKHYASDLFITWSFLEERLKDPNYTGEKLLFGFREMGMDSNTHVLSRLNSYGKQQMMAEIQKLYMLEVEVIDRDISMKLGKANLKERKV